MPNPLPPPTDPADLHTILDTLVAGFSRARATSIGFPAATDTHLQPLAPLLDFVTNNLGDPRINGDYPIHTKILEREAVDIIASMLRAPADDRWGYVTGGASEGSEHALWLARTRYPDGIVYHSTASHHCIPAAIERLRMPSITIRTDAWGEIDYDDLGDQISQHRHQPTIVVANIGTAITEAVDDIRRITTVLDGLAVTRRWIHADAALSGIPLSLLDPTTRPGFDFSDGADSIIVSGHKFLGSPVPSGVLTVRDSLRPDSGRPVTYTGAPNSTLTNSRSGLAAVALWYLLHLHGTELIRRAAFCRELAAYTRDELQSFDLHAWRHPHAFTVNLTGLPDAVARTWALPRHGEHSHIVCMPGITRDHIDRFLTALATVMPRHKPGRRPRIPRQRTPTLTGATTRP